MSDPQQTAYRVFPSVVAPIALSGRAVYFGLTCDYWIFAAIPFIVLGSVCPTPNLNLADGCLVTIAIQVEVAAALLFRPLGVAIVMGSSTGWLGGAVEKRIRMRPA